MLSSDFIFMTFHSLSRFSCSSIIYFFIIGQLGNVQSLFFYDCGEYFNLELFFLSSDGASIILIKLLISIFSLQTSLCLSYFRIFPFSSFFVPSTLTTVSHFLPHFPPYNPYILQFQQQYLSSQQVSSFHIFAFHCRNV